MFLNQDDTDWVECNSLTDSVIATRGWVILTHPHNSKMLNSSYLHSTHFSHGTHDIYNSPETKMMMTASGAT